MLNQEQKLLQEIRALDEQLKELRICDTRATYAQAPQRDLSNGEACRRAAVPSSPNQHPQFIAQDNVYQYANYQQYRFQ